MTTTDTKPQVYFGVHPEQLRIQNVDFGKGLRNASGAPTRSPTALLTSFLERHQTVSNLVRAILKLQKSKPHVPEKPTERTLMCLPEHFRRHFQKFLKWWLRIQYGVHTSYP